MHARNWLCLLLAAAVLLGGISSAFAENGGEEEIWLDDYEDIDVETLVDVEDLMSNGTLDDKGWWNILLLGGDSRADGKYGRTDAILILSVNPSTCAVRLTSIMRDIWVEIYDSGTNRINAANVYGGPQLVMRTVNECFGMNITDYALVNMKAFIDIVDLIGGIQVDVSEREMFFVNEQQYYNCQELGLSGYTELKEYGEDILLDGNQALAYVRIRHLDSDYVRTGRQRDALVAIARKLQQEGTITTIAGVVLTLLNYVETNLTVSELLQLAGIGLQMDMDEVQQLRLPVDGAFWSSEINGAKVIELDFPKNAQALYEFIYGEEE